MALSMFQVSWTKKSIQRMEILAHSLETKVCFVLNMAMMDALSTMISTSILVRVAPGRSLTIRIAIFQNLRGSRGSVKSHCRGGKNGMTADVQTGRQVLVDFEDICHVPFGNTDAAKVVTMKVDLKRDAQPVIAKVRRYNADQREFLNEYMAEMERIGFVR